MTRHPARGRMRHRLLRAGALLTLLLSSVPMLPPRRDRAEALEQAPAADRDTVDLTPYLASREARRAKVPWKIGEYFQFSIDWSGLNGGNALMQVQNIQTVDGHRTWRIITKAESNSFVSKFYKVRDRAESFVDAESLYTRRFEKHLREGSYKKDLNVRFDQAHGKAIYQDGKTYDVPFQVHDVLSAFYYVRTRPLPDGAEIVIPTHDNEKSYDMVVNVLRRERVEVPAGKFDCVLVEPVLKSEGIFKAKGQMYVWLSDDERRIPVQVKSKVPIGSISVSLTEMRLAFVGKH
ncbi:MAG: DUF3108 domain-containing protein [Candidatus Eisenbacteria bacterium]|uniref:DUF3108 domain-containing protein n=1 Tax=Eiseniibacteriota bacterium TaxID=2212470 RepID=A0A538TCN0_UNCEI|nr:MAG: DUF3108 domain-containing protein [Candidatus Eisenbacteria bacterium]TMQ61380.1 MAG: DUF3108 domain-containing protein [Candidatus Eisenbacteria bacterium]